MTRSDTGYGCMVANDGAVGIVLSTRVSGRNGKIGSNRLVRDKTSTGRTNGAVRYRVHRLDRTVDNRQHVIMARSEITTCVVLRPDRQQTFVSPRPRAS